MNQSHIYVAGWTKSSYLEAAERQAEAARLRHLAELGRPEGTPRQGLPAQVRLLLGAVPRLGHRLAGLDARVGQGAP